MKAIQFKIAFVVDNVGIPSREALQPSRGRTRPNGGCIDSAHRARDDSLGFARTAGLLPSGLAAGDCAHRTPEANACHRRGHDHSSHPNSAEAQVEGAELWGLSMAMHEGSEFVKVCLTILT